MGLGRDAEGLDLVGHRGVKVRGAWRIQNDDGYKRYWSRYGSMCERAAVRQFRGVRDLQAQGEVITRKLGISNCQRYLDVTLTCIYFQ